MTIAYGQIDPNDEIPVILIFVLDCEGSVVRPNGAGQVDSAVELPEPIDGLLYPVLDFGQSSNINFASEDFFRGGRSLLDLFFGLLEVRLRDVGNAYFGTTLRKELCSC